MMKRLLRVSLGFVIFVNKVFRVTLHVTVLALLTVMLMAAWIISDGLSDQGDKADLGMVPNSAAGVFGDPDFEEPWGVMQPRLDKAIELYHANKFTTIVISGAAKTSPDADRSPMGKYLEAHEIPAGSVIEDPGSTDTHEIAVQLAKIMKDGNYKSVMIVADYYQISRLKLALKLEGIAGVQQAHLGKLRQEDASNIAREVVAFYQYAAIYYGIPESRVLAKKLMELVKTGAEKTNSAVGNAKNSLDQKLDNMSK